MKFQDMPYARPDGDAVKAAFAALTDELRAANTFEEADRVFLAYQQEQSHFGTVLRLAMFRHDIDTRDEFYTAEREFFDDLLPELMGYEKAWNIALLESPFRADFEKKYNRVFLLNAEIALGTFAPEIVEDMQKENALTNEYSKLLATAKIPFEGKEYTLAQMEPFMEDADDARRLSAWMATGQWYADNQPRLNAIYDELVKLRDGMGKKLGGKDYTDLGYRRMNRNCYTREDVEKFRAAVRKYVVPVADSIYREQAKRLGVSYPLSFADVSLMFRSGNPVPCGTADDILNEARGFYHALSPETAEFIDAMLENGTMDVLAKDGKAGGGYCDLIPDYKIPFIFANFNGTSGDVETVTHEAGHAFAFWMSRNILPLDSMDPSLEACEVHSMSMEFFAWMWADRFYGKDIVKFRYSHLAGSLTFIPYGTLVDHFQHEMYDHPELTPAERHAVWKKLMGEYMPWLRLDGDIPFFSEGKHWQLKHHIYEAPYYYIDYCLASAISLQFWALIQQDEKAAWERYMKYTVPGGTMTFTELLANADLMSPFGDDCLRLVCEKASEWLDNYDLGDIK